MAGETYYNTGTATVANGSTAVTGNGTSWVTAGYQAGDYFAANGLSVRIAAVPTNTSITLASGWPGTALSSSSYELRLTPTHARLSASVNSLIALLSGGNNQAFAGLTGAANEMPYFTGAGTMSTATVTSFARTLLDDANASTALATLGAASTASLANYVAKADTAVCLPTTNWNTALLFGSYYSSGASNTPNSAGGLWVGRVDVNKSSAQNRVSQEVWRLDIGFTDDTDFTAASAGKYARVSQDGGSTWENWVRLKMDGANIVPNTIPLTAVVGLTTTLDTAGGVSFLSTTTSALSSQANAINTTLKRFTRCVYNSTDRSLYIARGGAVSAVWDRCDGGAIITPV